MVESMLEDVFLGVGVISLDLDIPDCQLGRGFVRAPSPCKDIASCPPQACCGR